MKWERILEKVLLLLLVLPNFNLSAGFHLDCVFAGGMGIKLPASKVYSDEACVLVME